MRSLFILAFVLMQFGATAADVPSNVQNSFKSKYPTATEVDWYDEEDGTFAVYFYVNEQSKTAKFNTAGSWTETKTFVEENQIPATISNAIQSAYNGSAISSVTMIELPNALNQYEVSIEMNEASYLLTYNENGELLKKLEEVAETDDAQEADDADDVEEDDTTSDDDDE